MSLRVCFETDSAVTPTTLAVFLLLADGESGSRFVMKLSSAAFALLVSLLIVGCATKEDQITPAEAALEKKDQRGWSAEEGRVP